MKPPVDPIDGPREGGSGDVRRRGRIGLGLVALGEALGLVADIAYPLMVDAFLEPGPGVSERLQAFYTVRWAIGFLLTLTVWSGLVLLARVPKTGGVALAAVGVGVLHWLPYATTTLLRKLGLSPGGLTSPFTLVDMTGTVFAVAYFVLLVVVARQAALGLSGKWTRPLATSLYGLIALLWVGNVAGVVRSALPSSSAHPNPFDDYGWVFEVNTWLSHLAVGLLVALYLRIGLTTKRAPAAAPPQLAEPPSHPG